MPVGVSCGLIDNPELVGQERAAGMSVGLPLRQTNAACSDSESRSRIEDHLQRQPRARMFAYLTDKNRGDLERAAGIEPATFSLGS
jgi:hypothetical protein